MLMAEVVEQSFDRRIGIFKLLMAESTERRNS